MHEHKQPPWPREAGAVHTLGNQSAAPIDQPKYAILAVQIRAGMGLKLYLSTFQLALALIPGAGHA